ncbi:hypothetical protein JO972_15765 [Verrucomicrobiaceae bacterium 5K15]|uniref:Uncharacterized protein n=1 Tax=Oceaniferula flava TaxID=2800421 RepID=A0AAE2SDL3_9BACT|nr:hypothetical protein [Oceaniferula flavus]MBK1856428.1 hypothetical protein [Oceaniferula flavus]MBM1137735.1 hypothetical protein [Oceaniferula flavus]
MHQRVIIDWSEETGRLKRGIGDEASEKFMKDSDVEVVSKAGPLEKAGHALLRRMGPTCPDGTSLEDQRVLTDEEQLQLRNIVRWTVFRAGLVGALSACAAAIAAVYAEQWFPDNKINYWLLFGGVSALAAMLEVGFLYYDSLRAVHRISNACDVELFPEGDDRSAMAGVMVRAAMELPNPPDSDPYVNPFREASKLKILLGVLMYKGKVLVSNALAKVLIRKIFARGAARAWLEFVAVPVTAIWNAVICFWVLREARVRAIGPSAILESLPVMLENASPELAASAQRAVGCCVAASRDLHPNHLQMLVWMRQRSGVKVTDEPEDRARFQQSLDGLDEVERRVAVDVFAMAAIIDGRVSARERKLLEKIAGNEVANSLRSRLHDFRMGRGLGSITAEQS